MPAVTYDSFHDVLRIGPHVQGVNAVIPLSVRLKVNNRCNFRCVRCLTDNTPGGCADFDLNGIVNALGECAPLRMVWSGGEPTLSPELRNYLAFSVTRGCYNIVATSMTQGDPFAGLAGKFFYDVSIYGTTKKEFVNYTGWDLFSTFERHFHSLFQRGHAVCATIRLHAGWRDFLVKQMRWLRSFPLRKLQILPLRDVSKQNPQVSADDAEIKKIIRNVAPGFPVAVAFTGTNLPDACISIEAATGSSAFARLNGEPMDNRSNFLMALKRLGPETTNCFTTQYTYYPS